MAAKPTNGIQIKDFIGFNCHFFFFFKIENAFPSYFIFVLILSLCTFTIKQKEGSVHLFSGIHFLLQMRSFTF